MRIILGCVLLLGHHFAQAQIMEKLTARQILDRCIAFHDPQKQWSSLQQVFYINTFSPQKPTTQTRLSIDNTQGFVSVIQVKDGKTIEYAMQDTLTIGRVDGTYNIAPADYNKYRLNPSTIKQIRNYYLYLYGLPMKLNDKGVILSDTVSTMAFNQQDCYVLTVNYEASVGRDTWFFYVNKANFALEGYRFKHNQQVNDGEWIMVKGYHSVQGIKMPKMQEWFFNKNNQFIATEVLEKTEPLKKRR